MAIRNSVRTSASESWTEDYLQRAAFPDSSGTLFGCWARSYNESYALPLARGNFIDFGVRGSNWSVAWLIDNMAVNTSHVVTRWNSNTMLFGNDWFDGSGWSGDYCLYIAYDEQTEAEATGWKWVGHQIILGGSSVTMRQWVKFGLGGTPIKTGDETVTFTQLRENLVSNAGWTTEDANAWTPSSLVSFQFGIHGTDNLEPAGDIVYAKAIVMSSEPSISALDDIALNFDADTSIWGDWAHEWDSGAPVTTDRSGNSRSLSSGGGTLYQGASFDDGASSFLPTFRKQTDTLLRR